MFSVGSKDHFYVNLEDDVVRGSIILDKGKLVWPPEKPVVVSPPPPPPKKVTDAAAEVPINYFNRTLKDTLVYTGGKRYY